MVKDQASNTREELNVAKCVFINGGEIAHSCSGPASNCDQEDARLLHIYINGHYTGTR
jgi:hypothetical protein